MFAFIIAVIAILGLLAPMPRAWHNRLGTSVADMMHVPAFAILTSLALAIVNRFLSQRFAVHLFVTGVVITASAGVEVAQSVLGRSASLHDLMANTAGAISALLIRVSLGSDTIFKRFCRVVAVCLLFAACARPCLSILDVLEQRKNKNALGTFATLAEFERWFAYHASPRRIANPFNEGEYTGEVRRSPNAAHVTLYPGDYPMFQLQHLVADWSRYRELRFNIGRPARGESTSDSDLPLVIQLRIRDWPKPGTESDSYYKRFTLLPGDQHEFRITLDQLREQSAAGTLNVHFIRFVEFLAMDMSEPSVFLLADVRLIK